MPVVREHYVAQAECRVVAGDDALCLTAVLGSCVAACLWDPQARVGGMNHFLLPRRHGGGRLAALGVGSIAMAVLLEECLRGGASRDRLQARLFGGGRVLPLFSDIGARNIAFARAFLQAEGIALVGEGVGGTRARRVCFWPATGAVQQRLVEEAPGRPGGPWPPPAGRAPP